MSTPRLAADAVRRDLLEQRVARLKLAAWAAVAGAWLAIWTLVSGAVAGTSATASVPTTTTQQSTTRDLFGNGSSLGTTSSTPVLRSHGS